MVWLVTHIWIFIGLAALFGLILGWAFRGIRVSGGARRAIVERNIALTELDQVRAELDSLYAAQRKQGNDGQIHQELQARDAKLGALEAELVSAREELVAFKADSEKKMLAAAAASAAVVGTGAVITTSGQDAPDPVTKLDADVDAGNAQLEWRNRYLESRVRTLETSVAEPAQIAETEAETSIVEDISEQVETLEANNKALREQIAVLEQDLADEKARDHGVVAGAAGLAAGAGAVLVGQEVMDDKALDDDVPDAEAARIAVERDKAVWQTQYLRQRLAFMEEHGVSEHRVNAPDETEPTPEETSADPVPNIIQTETTAEPAPEPADIEQELARLRWRNRYLEGRLAYIDGGATDDANTKSDQAVDTDKKSAAEALLERLERPDSLDT